MARAGVTYHDVAKAAEAIKSQRQEPRIGGGISTKTYGFVSNYTAFAASKQP